MRKSEVQGLKHKDTEHIKPRQMARFKETQIYMALNLRIIKPLSLFSILRRGILLHSCCKTSQGPESLSLYACVCVCVRGMGEKTDKYVDKCGTLAQ